MLTSSASINHLKLACAKKNISATIRSSLYAISTIDTSWEQSHQETLWSWEKEDVYFFLGTPAFLFARNIGGRKEGERRKDEKEWEILSERGETRRKLLRRVGTWPKVCKSETRGTKIGKGVGGYFAAKKSGNLHIGIVLASYSGPVASISC